MQIRRATLADVPEILEIYRPYVEHTAISFEYVTPSLPDFTERFKAITAFFPWLVWEEDDKLLGYAYGHNAFERAAYQWTAEVSVYLRQDARGRGIGKRLYAELEDILRKQGYKKAYAIITTANEASVAFHKAVGYRETCVMENCGYKFGNWYGTIWLEKELNGWLTPPGEPVSVHTLPETEPE